MIKVESALACNLDSFVLQAALPLLEQQQVEAIEWSFDTLHQTRNIPDWFTELLHTYSKGGGLIGHGVFFSLFTGGWSEDQQKWIDHLKKVATFFKFQHITEHFGFMTGANFHQGAPISIPLTESTLAIGRDRLQRIYEACECPVGLENLAFSYSLDEVKKHGDFLEKLIMPINGFIILDLHNLYCQMHNFELSFEEIIEFYPLHRVREIHISGGSWQEMETAPGHKVRRDTHDDGVPAEVFDCLKKALPICPNLKYVVMEQLGTGLRLAAEQERFRADYRQMKISLDQHNVVSKRAELASFLPANLSPLTTPAFDKALEAEQLELSNILESALDYKDAQRRLAHSALANTAWQVENWSAYMLEAVIQIAQKWKQGFQPKS